MKTKEIAVPEEAKEETEVVAAAVAAEETVVADTAAVVDLIKEESMPVNILLHIGNLYPKNNFIKCWNFERQKTIHIMNPRQKLKLKRDLLTAILVISSDKMEEVRKAKAKLKAKELNSTMIKTQTSPRGRVK